MSQDRSGTWGVSYCENVDYLKIPKWPRTNHRMMKMMTVLKQPPPNFFAPYPAATPRRSLLMSLSGYWSTVRRSFRVGSAQTVPRPRAWSDGEMGPSSDPPLRALRRHRYFARWLVSPSVRPHPC